MIRVFTDFNSMTEGDVCWLLKYGNNDFGKQIETMKFSKGDRILLYQDEDDFEVTATLDVRYVDVLRREVWVAVPDWSTIVYK